MSDNPFERYGLDPRDGPGAITERMRELVEEADEARRAELRQAWERLTLHPRTRLQAALEAHPEGRRPLPLPPEPAREEAGPKAALELLDLATLPSVEGAFAPAEPGEAGRATTEPSATGSALDLATDPLLRTKP